MSIPGSVPVTGFVAPTSTSDTYPSHQAIYGKGGLRTVADNTERDAIPAARREEGMEVFVINSGVKYRLDSDLTTWIDISTNLLPSDVMLKSVYDPNDDGIVTNSNQLNGQTAAYYLSRANHTGTQAQATITNLTTDLGNKQNTSEKGQANGYVPLNGSTKIDNTYLNFSLPLDPVVAWDVAGNVPAISDAGGTAGEIYIVYNSANPTARNLGSGSIDWYDGDIAVYDSGTSTFKRIAAYTIGVASVNGLTGAVTLDTSDISEATDLNYVSDDISDALTGATSPSATNTFVTQSDLLGALTVGNSLFMPELFANGETLGDGTLRTLASLGYNNGTAGAVWTRVNSAYTIDVNTMSIDWIAWQEACLAMEQDGWSYVQAQAGRGYCPSQSIALPRDQSAVAAFRRSQQFTFNLGSSVYANRTGTSFPIFDKYPTNQADANGFRLVYKYFFEKGRFYGNDADSELDCFIRLGGTSSSKFRDIEGTEMGMLIDAQFCLQVGFENINVGSYKVYGVAARDGLWSGAGADIAQSNNATIDQFHAYNGTGYTPISAIYCQGNRNINVTNSQFEGDNGSEHHILFDQAYPTSGTLAGTVKNCIRIVNTDWESAGASRAGIRIKGGALQVLVDTFNVQTSPVNMPVFLEMWHSPFIIASDVEIRNCKTYNPGFKFRQIGQHKWYVENVKLNNNASLVNASNWDTSLVGSSIPTTYRYTSVL